MVLFHNDYNETCHNAVAMNIARYSLSQMNGYGEDEVCKRAADQIRRLCNGDNLAVHFLVGGTQTNLIVIDAALRPHQAAICASTGHIQVHETGAVEATGHKIISLDSLDGKITAEQVRSCVDSHWSDGAREHMSQPKLVYISNPTELGTIYSLSELEQLSNVCKEKGLILFVDGARLGYALAAKGNDVTFADLSKLADVFYIGGTKVGAMFGEALVISNSCLAEDFRYLIKQHGAMLAKGWLLGAQFEALLRDDLYLEISRHGNAMADRLRNTLRQLHCPMQPEGVTNQVFAVLPNRALDVLMQDFSFSLQDKISDTHSLVRFCTSWATKPEDVDALCDTLRNLL